MMELRKQTNIVLLLCANFHPFIKHNNNYIYVFNLPLLHVGSPVRYQEINSK